jgi:hypothetical protein
MTSPVLKAPSASKVSSFGSPCFEENKEVSAVSLLTLLEKLQKCPKYRAEQKEYIAE